MLNLIKNEYIKIFHKKSTYVLLAFLLIIIIALPVFKKFYKEDMGYYYTTSYEEEISWAEESGDKTSAALYRKAQELKIPAKEFFSEEPNWRVSALSDVYYNYYDEIYDNDTADETEKKKAETYFQNVLELVEKDDWKEYYQFMIKNIQSDSELTASQKEAQIYFYQYMLDKDIVPNTGSWQENALYTYTEQLNIYNEGIQAQDNDEYYDEKTFESARKLMLITKYRLDHNIKAAIYEGSEDEIFSESEIYIYTGNLFNNMKNGIGLLVVVMILAIIIAGNIISKEFSQGTIKFLLINPVKRSKIFWSKYITVFSYAFFLTTAVFILEFAMSLLVFGTSELHTQLLTVKGNNVVAYSGFLFMFGRYMLSFVEIFVALTIAFTISSLFRNSALAIALSMIIYFIGSSVCEIAALLNFDFFRFTIFATQNMTAIVNGKSSFLHLTTEFAVIVLVIHIFLLLLTAHDAFTKKNV